MFVVAITSGAPTLATCVCVRARMCVCVCVMCICFLDPQKAKPTPPQAEPTTEGAQMCCWLEAEVGPAFSGDSFHTSYGSFSEI